MENTKDRLLAGIATVWVVAAMGSFMSHGSKAKLERALTAETAAALVSYVAIREYRIRNGKD